MWSISERRKDSAKKNNKVQWIADADRREGNIPFQIEISDLNFRGVIWIWECPGFEFLNLRGVGVQKNVSELIYDKIQPISAYFVHRLNR